MLSMHTDIDCLFKKATHIRQQNVTVQVLPNIVQKVCENIHWSQFRADIPPGIKPTTEIKRCKNRH